MPRELYMGIDIGTSVAKGTVIDAEGKILSQRRVAREMSSGVLGEYEHDADEIWWNEFLTLLSSLREDLGESYKSVRCLAITGMVPNVCLTDDNQRPVHKAILYYDPRAYDLEMQLDQELNTPRWQNEVLSKLLWLKEKLGSRWSKVARIFTTHNYVLARLTGRFCIDSVTAHEYGSMFSPRMMCWNENILGRFGINADWLPDVVPPAEIVGRLNHQASEQTGLEEGVLVTAGTSDTIGTFLGAGVHHASDLLIYYGTYSCAAVLLEDIGDVLFKRLPRYPIDWVASIPRGGQQLGALAQAFFPSEALDKSVSQLDSLAEKSTPGANGVTFVQTLNLPVSTNCTEPEGALFNLRIGTSLADICRAMLEAFGYGLRSCFESTLKSPAGRCFASGGGARSNLWRQIVSDVTGLEQLYFPYADRGYGSAVLAAIAAEPANLRQIEKVQNLAAEHILPNASKTRLYSEGYLRYKQAIDIHNSKSGGRGLSSQS